MSNLSPSSTAPVTVAIVAPTTSSNPPVQVSQESHKKQKHQSHYKGFVAGVFSGITKLSVGHPFDTLKVRLQTAPPSQFKGPIDCLTKTIRNEGVRGLYKGATPPLVGWMFMDSLMLGSLTMYVSLLKKYWYREEGLRADGYIPYLGACFAGLGAGFTVSFIAAPIEHVKARLQIQYEDARKFRKTAAATNTVYTGPIDCTRKLIRNTGFPGLFHGLYSTILFRTHFFVWWGCYSWFSDLMRQHTSLSTMGINFWAGGLSAQCFWLSSYPFDVVKQRIMTDRLVIKPTASSASVFTRGYDGGERYGKSWIKAVKGVYYDDVGNGKNGGLKAFWRGFGPCFLRSFPANAMALVVFETVMRSLPN